jgi:hypothetical protein
MCGGVDILRLRAIELDVDIPYSSLSWLYELIGQVSEP